MTTLHSTRPAGSRPKRRRIRVLAWPTVLAVSAACTDRGPTQSGASRIPGDASQSRVECSVQVKLARMTCGAAAPGGPSRNVILGGQNTYVRLASSGTRYDGESLLESSVTVQNLVDQPMGTPDGSTVYGMNVFFQSGPNVTAGSGTVTVANADGMGVFTASGQPYFHYDEILQPLGTSQPRLWRFRLPPTVESFAFTVLVDTRLAAEQGILRWQQVRGPAADSVEDVLNAIWCADGMHVVAVGARFKEGVIVRSSDAGATWNTTLVAGRGSVILRGVWGATPSSLFAVGNDSTDAVILHSSDGGATWSDVTVSPPAGYWQQLNAVWGSSATSLVIAGQQYNESIGRADAIFLRSSDGGATWSQATLQGFRGYAQIVRSLWGTSPTDLFAAGWMEDKGRPTAVMYHSSDGGTTWTARAAGIFGSVLNSVWADSAAGAYAVGYRSALFGGGYPAWVVIHSSDSGATWTTVRESITVSFNGVWGAGGSLYVAESFGRILQYNGTSWVQFTSGSREELLAISGTSSRDVWVSGRQGTILHGVR